MESDATDPPPAVAQLPLKQSRRMSVGLLFLVLACFTALVACWFVGFTSGHTLQSAGVHSHLGTLAASAPSGHSVAAAGAFRFAAVPDFVRRTFSRSAEARHVTTAGVVWRDPPFRVDELELLRLCDEAERSLKIWVYASIHGQVLCRRRRASGCCFLLGLGSARTDC